MTVAQLTVPITLLNVLHVLTHESAQQPHDIYYYKPHFTNRKPRYRKIKVIYPRSHSSQTSARGHAPITQPYALCPALPFTEQSLHSLLLGSSSQFSPQSVENHICQTLWVPMQHHLIWNWLLICLFCLMACKHLKHSDCILLFLIFTGFDTTPDTM